MDVHVVALFRKFQDNHCDAAEAQQVLQYMESGQHLDEWDAAIAQHAGILMNSPQVANMAQEDATALYQRIMTAAAAHTKQKTSALPIRPSVKHRPSYRRISPILTALLVIAVATGTYFLISKFSNHDIPPGYNQATLTLADGSKIALDSAQSGIIIGTKNIKYQSGKLVQNVMLSEGGAKGKSGAETSLPTSLTLSTPKGGQYQIILSDGTKVWLNAASTLKYPSRFSGNTREVFLEGEAYFEVNNNPSIGAMQDNRKSYLVNRKSNAPFIIRSRNQQTIVLGTEFNLNAYDPTIKTTLVSGAVQVASYAANHTSITLAVGEQSSLTPAGTLTKKQADITTELAWKNNKFIFTDKPFTQVMDELARWYDLKVVYEGEIPDNTFFGGIRRDNKLSAVLKVLESAHIAYRISADRTLTIIHKQK